jgi:hypothetical protein
MIFRIHCGHCAYLKVKTKRPNSKACENYIRTDPDDQSFVSKEYLSKALLEYMLKLELLPQIYDIENDTEDRPMSQLA